MKKLIFLVLVFILASCEQNNVADINTDSIVPTEKVETKTEGTQTFDKNIELRSSLEKMAEEYKNTQKHISFTDFEKVTGLKLGDDSEILPEHKDYAGVIVSSIKNDFVLVSSSMGISGASELYQLKDGKMEYIIGGNGDTPIEQCEKFDSLNIPAEFSSIKEQLCNYTR